MITTIMLDLDGTLLHFTQNDFIEAYFYELKKVYVELGLDPRKCVDSVWAGTRMMMRNDGSAPNRQRFWEGFAEHTGFARETLEQVEAACDSFYTSSFNNVKAVMRPSDIPARLVRGIASRGYRVILATNPLFPLCAVESRLAWAGLCLSDFIYISHYSNSSFCKPSPGYFREIFTMTGSAPENCLMAGNNPVEDMAVGALGAETFLVTDCLENETGMDVSGFRSGTLAELESYLFSLHDN